MNQRKLTGIVSLSLIVAGLASPQARAASPDAVTDTGAPVKWTSSQIKYSIDKGDLGTMKHADAVAMVDKAFQAWASLDTVKISFQKQADLTADVVVIADIRSVLSKLSAGSVAVIFDNQGAITTDVLRPRVARQTLAFGVPFASSDGKSYNQGVIIINGRAMDGLFGPDDATPADLQRAVTRAAGQMLGLGPSDTNDELRYDGNPANNSAVPIMYPPTLAGPTVLDGGTDPTLDDKMSLTELYPATTADTNTGWIQGTLTAADGKTGLQGIDVVARKVDDPVNSAVSAITGVTFRNGGGGGKTDPTLRGAFRIRVPPGDYTLEFRPLGQPIGPLARITPVPGGPQSYQTASPTAGPPAHITVTAGKATTANFSLAGKPTPDPQAVAQVLPDGAPVLAQPLPLSATVTGTADSKQDGLFQAASVDDQGNTIQDKIENLYRLTVPERSIVTLYLEPTDAVDLDLFVLNGFRKPLDNFLSALDGVVDQAQVRDTKPESLQTVLDPGTYLIGVSIADYSANAGSTDYQLSVTTTPLGDQPSTTAPVLNQLVVGNVTSTGADVSWTTDLDATGDAVVGMPLQQSGDATVGKLHHVTVGGLNAGSEADVLAISQLPDGVNRDSLPRVFFRTADSTAATGPAQLTASVVGLVDDSAAVDHSVLVALAIQNTGGAASNVQLTTLAASSGWTLAQPVTQPLNIGGIGSNGTAIVVVRLLRAGSATGPLPLATLTGGGTLAGAGGTPASFTISGP